MNFILQPFDNISVGEFLNRILVSSPPKYRLFKGSIAFAKISGVQHIESGLKEFIRSGGTVELSIGVDQKGTSKQGLQLLLDAISDNGTILINHNEDNYSTYHPKVYIFISDSEAIIIVGSNNLTEGGLYTNDEASIAITLDLRNPSELQQFNNFMTRFDNWFDERLDTIRRLTPEFLEQLLEKGYLSDEETINISQILREEQRDSSGNLDPLFGRGIARRRPKAGSRRAIESYQELPNKEEQEKNLSNIFVMTLMRTDVGIGQTTEGKNRRSPEIFIPLAARNYKPDFWGWPDLFNQDPAKPGKFDRRNVRMRIGGESIHVNMMTWPDKHDFRLRSESLRSAGEISDILKIEKIYGAEFEYYVEIIPTSSANYQHYLEYCSKETRNSEKRWGYY